MGVLESPAGMAHFRSTRRSIAVVILTFISLYIIYTLATHPSAFARSHRQTAFKSSSEILKDTGSEPLRPQIQHDATEISSPVDEPACRSLPGADSIVVGITIGAGEIEHKLPIHLLTLLKCTPTYAIFSDMEQTIGDFHVHDTFEYLSARTKKEHKEFKQYEELYNSHKHLKSLDDESAIPVEHRLSRKLEKWRLLPAMREAYHLHPHKKWYFFADADASVNWFNLLVWVNGLDSTDHIYTGAQNAQNGVGFAKGGSGILLSQAAMRRWNTVYKIKADHWEDEIADSCCGDVMLGRQMNDADVPLTHSFPIIQTEAPLTVDWNDRKMCAPAVTWHHATSSQIEMLWEFGLNHTIEHGYDEPLLFRDIFAHLAPSIITDRRDEWDNISRDWIYTDKMKPDDPEWLKLTTKQMESMTSFENCRAACMELSACMQFSYESGTCSMGKDIRFGKRSKGRKNKMSSGWIEGRVQAFQRKHALCDAKWAFGQ